MTKLHPVQARSILGGGFFSSLTAVFLAPLVPLLGSHPAVGATVIAVGGGAAGGAQARHMLA